jgi:hypothetical protein
MYSRHLTAWRERVEALPCAPMRARTLLDLGKDDLPLRWSTLFGKTLHDPLGCKSLGASSVSIVQPWERDRESVSRA